MERPAPSPAMLCHRHPYITTSPARYAWKDQCPLLQSFPVAIRSRNMLRWLLTGRVRVGAHVAFLQTAQWQSPAAAADGSGPWPVEAAKGACSFSYGGRLRLRIAAPLQAAEQDHVGVAGITGPKGWQGARRVGVTMTTISESASPRMPDGEAHWARGLPGTMTWEHTTGSLRHSRLLLPMSSSCARGMEGVTDVSSASVCSSQCHCC